MTFFVETLRVPVFWLTPCIMRHLESKFGHLDQNLLPATIFWYGPQKMGSKFHENAISRERLVVQGWLTPHFMRNMQVSIDV